MASTATSAPSRAGTRVQVQKFGTFLSNMVMPNIGAFVAWGLIFNLWLCLVGGVLVVAGIYGWILEPATAPGAAHDDHHDDGPEPTDGGDSAEPEEAALVD